MLINPFISVDDLAFNDIRQVIREKMNESYNAGVKEFGEIKDYYDYFTDSDMFVYYDRDDRVAAFEFFKPNPMFNNMDLLNNPYEELYKAFLAIDEDLITEPTSFFSNRYGIGIHCLNAVDEHSMPESVIVFKKGYYD